MFRKPITLLALAGWLSLATQAPASIVYEYTTDQSSYTAQQGTNIAVNLYLLEQLSGGSTSLINSDGGLFSGAVGIQQAHSTSSTATIIKSISNNLSPVGPGGGFGMGGGGSNQNSVSSDGKNAALVDQTGFGVHPGPTTDSTGRILLGTATLTAGLVTGTTTTFTITSFVNSDNSLAIQGGEGNTRTTNNGYDLDLDNNGGNPGDIGGGLKTYQGANDVTFTFSVQVVAPEPGSLALAFVAAGISSVGVFRHWHKRRKAQV